MIVEYESIMYELDHCYYDVNVGIMETRVLIINYCCLRSEM